MLLLLLLLLVLKVKEVGVGSLEGVLRAIGWKVEGLVLILVGMHEEALVPCGLELALVWATADNK